MKMSGVCLTVLILALAPATQLFAADAQAGKAIYDKQCVGCHGADGKGNPAMIKVMGEKGLNVTGKDTMKRSDEELLKIIAEGAGKMPAAKGLTPADQKQVLSYTRSLAK